MFKIIAILMGVFLNAFSLNAQEVIVTNASAGATINLPLVVMKTSEMKFGKFTANETAGEITLTPNNERYTSGGIKIVAFNEAASAVSFLINNTNNIYSLVLPAECMIVRQEGSETMKICYFDFRSTIKSEDGQELISIGATLNVKANQKAGLYTPSTPFNIVFNYN